MPANQLFGVRIRAQSGSGENPLPHPLPNGIGIFSVQRLGQHDLTSAFLQIGLMQGPHGCQMFLQRHMEALGKDGNAVLLPFALADDDFIILRFFSPHCA